MSELVVHGMKMPVDCESCPVCDYEQANCLIADDRNTLPHVPGKRAEWCPLGEKGQPETFADAIRAMSDEDLADWLVSHDLKCYWEGHLTKEGYLKILREKSDRSLSADGGE